MLVGRLETLRKSQAFVSVGRRLLTDSQIIGQVRQLSDPFVQLVEYDSYGNFDGTVVVFLEHITDLFWETREIRSIESLATKKTVFEVSEADLSSLEGLLNDLTGRGPVGLYKEGLGDGGQFGRVVSANDSWVQLDEFSPKSNMNLYRSLLRIDDITRVEAGSIYLNDLDRLYEGVE